MNVDFIQNLKYKLSLPLPGREAQFLMAPSFRKSMTKYTVAAKAAVLLLLYPKNDEWSIVFIKRSDYLGIHSGQISFPGGKFDIPDTNMEDTALRETEEEIGVTATELTIIGKLTKLYIPVSEFEVYPVVGFTNTRPVFKIDPYEVQYLIEAKVKNLLNLSIRMERSYSDNYVTGIIPYFNIDSHEIWGATAMILNEFLTLIVD